MDDLFTNKTEKKGINRVLIGGAVVGVVVVGVVVGLLLLKPSRLEQDAKILAASLHEGSPEFAELTRDIIISTDQNTIESPMATGTISMFINGKIRNKGTRTVEALEINVAVVTQQNQVLKEKRLLVVPRQVPRLDPGQIIPVSLSLDGFAKTDDRANILWKVTAIGVNE